MVLDRDGRLSESLKGKKGQNKGGKRLPLFAHVCEFREIGVFRVVTAITSGLGLQFTRMEMPKRLKRPCCTSEGRQWQRESSSMFLVQGHGGEHPDQGHVALIHSLSFSKATGHIQDMEKHYKKRPSNAAATESSPILKTRLLSTSHWVPGSGNFPVRKYSRMASWVHVEV